MGPSGTIPSYHQLVKRRRPSDVTFVEATRRTRAAGAHSSHTMAQQPMTPFFPIFASKSDGQHIVNLKGRPLRNGPTEEQLNTTPNDQGQRDFYRLIDKDDPKHQDWRKKLGGMLLREVGGKQQEGRQGARRMADCRLTCDRQVAAMHPVGAAGKLRPLRAHQDQGRRAAEDGQEPLGRRPR
ncbi:hypothetical protein IG631_22991 [Alternaria alternata]|jgi:hypothetical protein|nr:hypothetical protein IG631_22991 [Alternaria alternata]